MRKSFLALAVAASLVTSHPSLLGQVWDFLASIWSESAQDEGCGFDPSGRCIPATQPQTDAGCGFDPNGLCFPDPRPQADEGCGFDPNGAPCFQGS